MSELAEILVAQRVEEVEGEPLNTLRTWPEIIESTFERVKYGFTTA
jgi:hypothetical protein